MADSATTAAKPATFASATAKENSMKILNATQHAATAEQLAAGVVEPDQETKESIKVLLTFDSLPSRSEIEERAAELAEIIAMCDMSDSGEGEVYPNDALIGGAPWFMSALEKALLGVFVTPLYAFSVRESVEEVDANGSVVKRNVFRHVGFVGG